jgi:hypothetical protein
MLNALNRVERLDPMKIRFETPLTDEQLERFCADNPAFRIERTPSGEIAVSVRRKRSGKGLNGPPRNRP